MGHGEDHRRRPRPAAGPRVQSLTSRHAEVAPERLAGWLDRFTASHGPVETMTEGPTLILRAGDGTRARLACLWPPPIDEEITDAEHLAAHAALPRTALLLLVRRGGWGVGLARDGVLLVSATGTRYVQSRTAAGGWSQQRYARRRAGQAAGLVGACIEGLVSLLTGGHPAPEVLAVGGDRALVADVLGDRRLADAAALPRSALLEVPDPRRAVLVDVAGRVRAVGVRVDDPQAPPLQPLPAPLR